MSRLSRGQICGGLHKSLRPLHSALYTRVHMRYGRHRSPCKRTLTNHLETKWACSRHIDAAAMSRRSSCINVEALFVRAPDKPQINAERPAAACRPLHHLGICELLGHGANRPSHSSHPEARNTHRSKLPVTGHDLWPHERPRGGVRWVEAHRLTKPLPWQGKAVPAARTHVWDITLVVGFKERACM